VSGQLAGSTARRVPVAARKRRIKLKAKNFNVGARAEKTVKLKLPKKLRLLLARRGRLPLRLTAKVRDPAGNTRTVNKRITPKLRRKP
jgi:hypothetical protein